MSGGAEAADNVEDAIQVYRGRIIDLYTEHNPSKVAEVDKLLEKYSGQPHVLYKAICKKYEVQPEPGPIPDDDDDGGGGTPPAPSAAAAPETAAPLSAWGRGLWSGGLNTLQKLQGAAEGLRDQVEKTFDEAIKSEEDMSALDVVQGLRGAVEKGVSRHVEAAAAPTEAQDILRDKESDGDAGATSDGQPTLVPEAGLAVKSAAELMPADVGQDAASAVEDAVETTPALVEALKERITAIYQEHNPTKVPEVDRLMEKYSGREHVLYGAICKKYEVEPDPALLPEEEPTLPSVAQSAAETAEVALSSWGRGLLSGGLLTLQTLQGAAEGLKEQVEKTFDEAIRSEEEVSAIQVVEGFRDAVEKGAERGAAIGDFTASDMQQAGAAPPVPDMQEAEASTAPGAALDLLSGGGEWGVGGEEVPRGDAVTATTAQLQTPTAEGQVGSAWGLDDEAWDMHEVQQAQGGYPTVEDKGSEVKQGDPSMSSAKLGNEDEARLTQNLLDMSPRSENVEPSRAEESQLAQDLLGAAWGVGAIDPAPGAAFGLVQGVPELAQPAGDLVSTAGADGGITGAMHSSAETLLDSGPGLQLPLEIPPVAGLTQVEEHTQDRDSLDLGSDGLLQASAVSARIDQGDEEDKAQGLSSGISGGAVAQPPDLVAPQAQEASTLSREASPPHTTQALEVESVHFVKEVHGPATEGVRDVASPCIYEPEAAEQSHPTEEVQSPLETMADAWGVENLDLGSMVEVVQADEPREKVDSLPASQEATVDANIDSVAEANLLNEMSLGQEESQAGAQVKPELDHGPIAGNEADVAWGFPEGEVKDKKPSEDEEQLQADVANVGWGLEDREASQSREDAKQDEDEAQMDKSQELPLVEGDVASAGWGFDDAEFTEEKDRVAEAREVSSPIKAEESPVIQEKKDEFADDAWGFEHEEVGEVAMATQGVQEADPLPMASPEVANASLEFDGKDPAVEKGEDEAKLVGTKVSNEGQENSAAEVRGVQETVLAEEKLAHATKDTLGDDGEPREETTKEAEGIVEAEEPSAAREEAFGASPGVQEAGLESPQPRPEHQVAESTDSPQGAKAADSKEAKIKDALCSHSEAQEAEAKPEIIEHEETEDKEEQAQKEDSQKGEDDKQEDVKTKEAQEPPKDGQEGEKEEEENPLCNPIGKYREAIVNIYQQYNPSKVEDVDKLLEKYSTQPNVLYEAICGKYKVEPDPELLAGPGSSSPSSSASPPSPAPSLPAAVASTSAPAAGPSISSWGGGFLSGGLRTLQTLQGAAEGLRDQVEKTFDEAIRSEEDMSTTKVVENLRGAVEKSVERQAVAATAAALEARKVGVSAPVPAQVVVAPPVILPTASPAPAAAAQGGDGGPAADAAAPAAGAVLQAQFHAQLQEQLQAQLQVKAQQQALMQAQLQEQFDASQADRERLSRELKTLRGKHAHLIEEGKNMSRRVQAVEERMKIAVSEARRAEGQVAELERGKENLQAQVVRLTARAEKAEASSNEHRNEVRRLTAEVDRVRKDLQGEKKKNVAEEQASQMRSKEQSQREQRLDERFYALTHERDELLSTNSALSADLQRALVAADAAESQLQRQVLEAERASELQQRRLEAVELEFASQSLPFQRRIADLEAQLADHERLRGEREAQLQRQRDAERAEMEAELAELKRREELQERREREIREQAANTQQAAAEAAEAKRQAAEVRNAAEVAERARESAEAELRLEVSRKRSAEQRAVELTERVNELSRKVTQLQAAASSAAVARSAVEAASPASTPTGLEASAASAALAGDSAATSEAEARRLRLQVESLTRQNDALQRESSRLQNRVDTLQQQQQSAAGGRGAAASPAAVLALEQRFEAALQAIGRLQEELEATQEQRESYKQECHQLSVQLGGGGGGAQPQPPALIGAK